MNYTFKPSGVCPSQITVETDDNYTVQSVKAIGGCSGNLQGINALIKGVAAEDAVARLKGIKCSFKNTSCPDQIALALEKILEQQENQNNE